MKHSVVYKTINSVFPLNTHKKGRAEQDSKMIFPILQIMNLEQSEFKACAPSKDTGPSNFELLAQCFLLLISIYTL